MVWQATRQQPVWVRVPWWVRPGRLVSARIKLVAGSVIDDAPMGRLTAAVKHRYENHRWEYTVTHRGDRLFITRTPVVPDTRYALVVEYWKSYTDMSSASDTCDVPDARIDLVMHRALWWIYQRDHFARAQACLVTYERELQRHIAMDRGSAPGAVQMGERRVDREAPDTFVDVRDLVI